MQGIAFSTVTAGAMTPEQLPHYVSAVSGRRTASCGPYIAYLHEGHAVLAAYPEAGREDPTFWDWSCCTETGEAPAVPLEDTLACLRPHCTKVTVLAPFRPAEAPQEAVSIKDCYWQIPLPPAAYSQKLRNMLKRAAKEITVHQEAWSGEHARLVAHYLGARPLSPGTRAIFANLGAYAAQSAEGMAPGVRLFSARRHDGELAGFTLGDFTALRTAFYMFSFRQDNAPPGTADLLLHHLVRKADELGHECVNLGLGISNGITFFKKKWGAVPLAPYVETTFSLTPPARPVGLFSGLKRIFGNLRFTLKRLHQPTVTAPVSRTRV